MVDHPRRGIMFIPSPDNTLSKDTKDIVTEETDNHPEYVKGMFNIIVNETYGNLVGIKFMPWTSDEQKQGLTSFAQVVGKAIHQEVTHNYDDSELIERGKFIHPPLTVEKCSKFRTLAKTLIGMLSNNGVERN